MRVSFIPYVQGRNAYSDPDGKKYGIAIHNTSNTATAEAEASYATRRTDGVSSHFYVDNNSMIQSLDTVSRAGHAGSSTGNNNAVAVEITGVNGWSRTQWLSNVDWALLGRVLAEVVRFYGISVRRATVSEMKSNPAVKAFYGHDDMRQAWGGTTHTDPGSNFPWDKLFEVVNAALSSAAGGGDMTTPTWFRQEDWDNMRWRQYSVEVEMHDTADGGPAAGQALQLPRTIKRIEQMTWAETNALAFWIRLMVEGRNSPMFTDPTSPYKAWAKHDGIPEVLAAIEAGTPVVLNDTQMAQLEASVNATIERVLAEKLGKCVEDALVSLMPRLGFTVAPE